MRMQQLGDDMLLDGITYPTFVDSLLEDERLLKPDNLTQLREEYDAKLALPAPGRKEIEAARRALPLPPQEELMRHHGYDKHGNDLWEKRRDELRRLEQSPRRTWRNWRWRR